MTRKVRGAESQLLEVTRIEGERGRGAGTLYAWGYADFGALLKVDPWRVAQAVVSRDLEPLSFVELAYARRHGLKALASVRDNKVLAKALSTARPKTITETVRAKPSGLERPYGLRDLWAFGHSDIASACWMDLATVHNRQKWSSFTITDLAGVLDFVVANLPTKQASKLGLTE